MATMLLPGFEPKGHEARPTAERPTAESNEFFTPQWLLDWLVGHVNEKSAGNRYAPVWVSALV